jgi:pheromone shutdown protein TraB
MTSSWSLKTFTTSFMIDDIEPERSTTSAMWFTGIFALPGFVFAGFPVVTALVAALVAAFAWVLLAFFPAGLAAGRVVREVLVVVDRRVAMDPLQRFDR